MANFLRFSEVNFLRFSRDAVPAPQQDALRVRLLGRGGVLTSGTAAAAVHHASCLVSDCIGSLQRTYSIGAVDTHKKERVKTKESGCREQREVAVSAVSVRRSHSIRTVYLSGPEGETLVKAVRTSLGGSSSSHSSSVPFARRAPQAAVVAAGFAAERGGRFPSGRHKEPRGAAVTSGGASASSPTSRSSRKLLQHWLDVRRGHPITTERSWGSEATRARCTVYTCSRERAGVCCICCVGVC